MPPLVANENLVIILVILLFTRDGCLVYFAFGLLYLSCADSDFFGGSD